MTLELKSAAEFSIPELAQFFNQAFEGYIGGKIEFTPISYLQFLARDNTDLTLSRVAVQDDQPVGFGLIARQGWTSRVAGMGIVAKGQGVGKWLMEQLIQDARHRGDHRLVLEVFEQNTPALNLYQRAGFEIVRRLLGYTAKGLAETASADIHEIDLLEVAKVVMYYGAADLPWQMSGTAIARVAPPNRAYQLDHAYAIISNPTQELMVLRSLIVLPEYRRQGEGSRMLGALAAQYPGRQWTIPAICPEEFGVFLEPMGFERQELNQMQMALRV